MTTFNSSESASPESNGWDMDWLLANTPDPLTLPPSKWPLAPRKGTAIPVNAEIGKEFHAGLLAAYAMGKIGTADPLERHNGILRETSSFLHDDTCPIQEAEGLMVGGTGIILGLNSVVDEQEADPIALHGTHAFGTMYGHGLGHYPVLKGTQESDGASMIAQYAAGTLSGAEFESATGVALIMQDVTVCMSNGEGRLVQEVPYALVPIHVPSLKFHKAVLDPDRWF